MMVSTNDTDVLTATELQLQHLEAELDDGAELYHVRDARLLFYFRDDFFT